MALQTASFTIQGVAPLLMNNVQKADPLNQWAKALKAMTKKRVKTDEDLAEIARIEWCGGLYLGADGSPCLTGEAIEATIREGAKKSKEGKKVQSGVFVQQSFPLLYDGPKNPDKMWAADKYRDTRRVCVQTRSVMRTRPIFHEWACEFVVHFNPSVCSEMDIRGWLEVAGELVGMLDYRPRFGRFNVI